MAFSIQGDVSYFRPTSSILREIYGNAWVDYKFDMEGPISSTHWFWKRLSVFGDVSYLSQYGHSIGGHDRTQIQIVPISLGLKWVQPVNSSIDFYLGAAPRYFFLTTHDHNPVVKNRIHKNGLGGVVLTGFTFDIWKKLYLDLFTSYSFKHFDKPSTPRGVEGQSLEVGGLDIGAGFGWQF